MEGRASGKLKRRRQGERSSKQYCGRESSSSSNISQTDVHEGCSGSSYQRRRSFDGAFSPTTGKAMTSKPEPSFSEPDAFRADAWTKTGWCNQRGKPHRGGKHWHGAERNDQPPRKQRGGYNNDLNRHGQRNNPQRDEGYCFGDTTGHYSGKKKNHRSGRNGASAPQQEGSGPSGSAHGSSNNRDFPGNSGGSSRNKHRDRHRGGRGSGRGGHRISHQQHYGENSSQSTTSSSLDIPGFYYDPEKKRYFKIQASSEVKVGDENAITKESIAKKKAEVQRQKDLAALEKSTCTSAPSETAGRTPRKSCRMSVSSLLLNGYQRGEVDEYKLRRALILGSSADLRQTGKCLAFPHSLRAVNNQLEHMKHMEMSEDHNQLLCLWSTCGTLTERLQLINVKDSKRTKPGELALEFSPSSSPVLRSQSKITSVCWSDFPQHPGKKFVLYTSMCHTSQTHSLALIRCLDAVSPDQVYCYDFDIGTKATWTCSWNYHKQQFAVGSEKGCLVIDVKTRRLWQFNTRNSDTLAHTFSKNDGSSLMYTGTRKGNILKHDLRSSSAFPVDSSMDHKISVCCLRLSPGENYIYASDFSGKIKQWDLRMQKPVLSYEGLFNQHSKLPFHIDETQSLLYAGGQDCYTKIWCLRSGKLLHSIPPPYEASLYTIPAVQFSTRWGGTGNMGLVMGALNSFYLYGFQDGE